MANAATNRAKLRIFDSSLDFLSDTLKFGLGVGATYVFNNNHDVVNDGGAASANVGQNEATGTNYAPGFAGAGRRTLAGKAVTEDDTQDYAKWTASNLLWTAIDGVTATFGWLYKHVTSDAVSELLFFFDSGFPWTANGGDVTLAWDTTHGIATLG